MIYFLQRDDLDIKIGTTVDCKIRLSALIAQHGDLELMGLMDGSYEVERELHKRFAEFRRGKSEFFAPAPELIEFIQSNTHLNVPTQSEMTIIKVADETAHVIRVIASALGITQGQVVEEAVSHYFERELEAVRNIRQPAKRDQDDASEN